MRSRSALTTGWVALLAAVAALGLAIACAASSRPAPAAPAEVVIPSDKSAEPAPSESAPVVVPPPNRDAPPPERPDWPLFEHASRSCGACLSGATDKCTAARTRCSADPDCGKYLECVAACPPSGARDADGGYPQADCVIACKTDHDVAGELGDAYLWCGCCDNCQRECSAECGRYKSGIAGPIGAGCD